MSSLAATRADGFYYGPDYNPEKHGSLNKYRGSHPLGVRAKDLHIGVLVIRFELPFKVKCLSCERIIDKGVRFNAKKKRVGSYLSTPVYSFTFECPSCSNECIITTDPKRARYICSQGVRQRQAEDEPDPLLGNPRLLQPEERERLEANPIQKMEHRLLLRRQRHLLMKREDEEKLAAEETPEQKRRHERIIEARTAAAELLQLQELQQCKADDYGANRRMREQLHQRKRAKATAAAAAVAAATAAAAAGDEDEAANRDALNGVRFRKRQTRIDKLVSRLAQTHASIFPKHKGSFSSICKSDAVARRLSQAAPPKRRRIHT